MLTVVGILSIVAAGDVDPAGIDLFERRIRPVLIERCYKCHGPEVEKPKGGLRVDSRAGLLAGGGRGPALVPGDPKRSLILRALGRGDPDLQMPPREELPAAAIEAFASWIALGAPEPPPGEAAADPAGAAGAGAAGSPAAASRQHWAFQPPRDFPPPAVKDEAWPRDPIDRFILARLEERGLPPAPPAGRRTLIRRLTFDLHGLPPSPEEVEAFACDDDPRAVEELVDRLLSSPRFGERWGRHWLDVARFADTKGYVYSDREEARFVHSHVYRDWVIRAFNEDLPYDRFLLLQLAADRLADESGDRRDLAAMGFLTLGRRLLGNIHDIIDDRIDTVTRGTLGLTVACARCHDHKYDPVPTSDYYSLYGVFQGSTEELVSLDPNPVRTEAYLRYEKEMQAREGKLAKTFRAKREALAERLRAEAARYLGAVLDVEKLPSEEFYAIRGPDDLNPVVVRQWQAYLFGTEKGFHPVFAPWHALRALPEAEFAARAQQVLAALEREHGAQLNPRVIEALAAPPPASMAEAAERYGRLLSSVHGRWREALEEAAASDRPVPGALPDPAAEELRQVLYGPGSPAVVPLGAISEMEWFFDEPTRVELAKLQAEIERWIIAAPGSPPHAVILTDRTTQRNPRVFRRGNPADRGEEVPRRFLAALSKGEREPFRTGSGRLELARAIASPENPLTARVMVNRIWMHLFGAGLVRTPSDFGTRCEPPSHPELLDWLAVRFVEGGWSMKSIIRRIVLSSAYRQAAEGDPRSLEADPENRLIARMAPRRLDFESLRDALLAVTGELDLTLGGKPVDLAARPFSARRTVYGLIDRQFLPGMYRVFDFANPDQHSPQRHATTVPQQALFFLNSPFVVERARALAARPDAASAADPAERIRRLYRRVLQREPAPGELRASLDWLAAQELPASGPPPPPPPSAWRYGYGELDEASGRVKTFDLLPHFNGEAWQGGPKWPDEKLGWAQLTAEGGHAGNDLRHAVIRRWVAPRRAVVEIHGTVVHAHAEGDGIRARIAHGSRGLLWSAEIHNGKAEASAAGVAVEKGETIDFMVDIKGSLGWDDFSWAPVLRAAATAEAGAEEWSARKEFAGTAGTQEPPLGPWERYAQVLLFSNELMFID